MGSHDKSKLLPMVYMLLCGKYLWPVWLCLLLRCPSLWLLFPNRSDPSTLDPLFWLFFLPTSYPNNLFNTTSHPPYSVPDLPYLVLLALFHSIHLLPASIFIGFIIYLFSLERELYECRNLCSPLCSNHLERCLSHRRHSTSIGWINYW